MDIQRLNCLKFKYIIMYICKMSIKIFLPSEKKAKVVASDWGEEFIQLLAALAVLPRTILNNRTNCTSLI